MDYNAALDRVMSLADFERSTHSPDHAKFHLERMSLLLQRLGNPHLGRSTVHVAGTKGKGSTAAMITSTLAASGRSVGLYTSPHLHRTVERIRIGLDPISPEEFGSLVEQVWPEVQWASERGGYGGITTFEILTAMAFQHFKERELDFQVLEVGLGGRLDATNVATPDLCVITSISLDHMATLGDTIPEIAAEKAGIIKPGVPVVVAPQTDEAFRVIDRTAKERGSTVIDVARQLSWDKGSADLTGQTFVVQGRLETYDLFTPLLGPHQLENATTAVAAAETLNERGFALSKDAITKGLRDVRWPARLEVLSSEGPVVVVDGAHNPYSIGRLVEAVKESFTFARIIVIFGGLSGHSVEGMLDELKALRPEIVAVKSRHPRSAPSAIISEIAKERGLTVVFESDDVVQGLDRALDLAGEHDLMLGTGSLFVAAEITEVLSGIEPEVYRNIKPPLWESKRAHP